MILNVPRTRLKLSGDRAFSVVAPKRWNSFPLYLWLLPTLGSFEKKFDILFIRVSVSPSFLWCLFYLLFITLFLPVMLVMMLFHLPTWLKSTLGVQQYTIKRYIIHHSFIHSFMCDKLGHNFPPKNIFVLSYLLCVLTVHLSKCG